ncbi:hypothetical protein ANO11243_085570 [Dothideomycetidae sp. 11243]|nr:hypothetical protein ANO11243_085570 [fungal sp. No.11243]
MEATQEDQACTAYSRFILDTGMQQDWFALQMAMLPCLLGYGMVAARIAELQKPPRTEAESHEEVQGSDNGHASNDDSAASDNAYLKWIGNYTADDYVEAIVKGCNLAEQYAAKQSPSRIEELVQVFLHATNMETGFWDMGLRAGEN